MASPQLVIPAGARPVVVPLPDQIDMANAGQIGAQLDAALAPGVTTVVADMTATTFCDCSGIGMLIRAHKKASANNAQLRVVIPAARILRTLTITKADDVLLIYPTLHDALEDALAPQTRPPG